MPDEPSSDRALRLTAKIVSAHVGHNSVPTETVSTLIETVFRTLANISAPMPEAETLTPAVPIKKSVFPDYLVCLEDGKKMKMLKRHLQNAYGLSPDEYRQKWGLPASYPMVAANYALRRSSLAKSIGLGRKPREAAASPAMDDHHEAEEAPPALTAADVFMNFPAQETESEHEVGTTATTVAAPKKSSRSSSSTRSASKKRK